MLSFAAVRTLTRFLLDVEADADDLGWGHPPLLLLVQDRPAPSATTSTRRQMRAVQLPLRAARVGRYRAGLPDFLTDLATALRTDRPLGRPTLAACVDLGLIVDLVAEPLPGLRLVAWAICYEDVLVAPDDLREVRRVDAVDADGRGYRITRVRGEQRPVVAIDEQSDDRDEPTRTGLTTLIGATTRRDPQPPRTP
ncbi:hypothetical protein [Micromonospora fluostatini]|uniref:hypothetical protein n=1 Tax=Micromonospora sp. JCM 30529 TaxID=3421643 RepID=UPI003D17495D